jgi:D-alanyl-D-alanine carboxypeptidase
VLAGGGFRSFLADGDTRAAFVDGDDLLALVNRSPTGALPPGYAPADLVDVHDGSTRAAWECESAHACLRREAATALHHLLDQMRVEGMPGRVESAFRGFGTQCWVFASWARQAHAGFCEATTQSALPGHSQHQLGTTVDMFTSDWASHGAVFRDGFGCTPGGKWLDENAWRYGFAVSYPIDPDDRKDGSRCLARWDRPVPIDPKTGYKHEPWHLRFLGVEAAAQLHDAWLASGPGSPAEITLEQWLRGRRGLVGDAELPVCDGCQCGACATMADDGDRTPCGDASLRLDASGRVVAPAEEPRLVDASVKSVGDGVVVVEAKVHAPPHTPTQTPVMGEDAPTYAEGATFQALAPYPGSKAHRYDDLPGAWRVAVEPLPAGEARWPWRASLAQPELGATWNRANVVLPARAGDASVHLRVAVPRGATGLRVTLLRGGVEQAARELHLP